MSSPVADGADWRRSTAAIPSRSGLPSTMPVGLEGLLSTSSLL